MKTKVIAKVSKPNPDYKPYRAEEGRMGTPEYLPARYAVGNPNIHVDEECILWDWFVEAEEGGASSVVGLVEKSDGSFETVWCGNIKLVK